ncbi:DEAD/DEAH box helicase [Corynebacterium mendelii]|uniref:DEAD/DEAH box helicase n=1 Tax=Corynebacterium mendelii TaxID=2765362 RepID=A0A939E0W1_9CORY|nr:DEAD/DEAH box helicase [Corynebacterium mendelii]MBN9644904.1 DEAD/DEAH box helicase [Corynebacterium mendelii]
MIDYTINARYDRREGLVVWISDGDGRSLGLAELDDNVLPHRIHEFLAHRSFRRNIPVTVAQNSTIVEARVTGAALTPFGADKLLSVVADYVRGDLLATRAQRETIGDDLRWLAHLHQGIEQRVRSGAVSIAPLVSDGQTMAVFRVVWDRDFTGFYGSMIDAAPHGMRIPDEECVSQLADAVAKRILGLQGLKEKALQPLTASLVTGKPLPRSKESMVHKLPDWFDRHHAEPVELVIVVDEDNPHPPVFNTTGVSNNVGSFYARCVEEETMRDELADLGTCSTGAPAALALIQGAGRWPAAQAAHADFYASVFPRLDDRGTMQLAETWTSGNTTVTSTPRPLEELEDLVGPVVRVSLKARVGDDPALKEVVPGHFTSTQREQIAEDLAEIISLAPVLGRGEHGHLLGQLEDDGRLVFAESEQQKLGLGQAIQHRQHPYEMHLTLQELSEFLDGDVQRLGGAGFHVMVPSIWTKSMVQIRAEVSSSCSPKGILDANSLVNFNWRMAVGGREISEEEMKQLITATGSVVQLREGWVCLDQRSLRAARAALARTWRESHKEQLGRASADDQNSLDISLALKSLRGDNTLSIARMQQLTSGGDDAVWSNISVDFDTDDISRILGGTGIQTEQLDILDPLEDVQADLRDYQSDGVAWMQWMSDRGMGVILADDMGLGKTLQVLTLTAADARADAQRFAGTVAPLNWQIPDVGEMEKYGRFLPPGMAPPENGVRFRAYSTAAEMTAAHLSDVFRLPPSATATGQLVPGGVDADTGLAPGRHTLRQPTLVVAPAAVVDTWRNEIGKFLPDYTVHVQRGPNRPKGRELAEIVARHDFTIISYATLRHDSGSLSQVFFERLVVDEAQNVKNPKTGAWRAVNRVQRRHTIAVTGTPVENSVMDLWSVMELIVPGYLGDKDTFRTSIANPVSRDPNCDEASLLQRLTGPFILRREKNELDLGLGEKVVRKVKVSLTGEQAALYEHVCEKYTSLLDGGVPAQARSTLIFAFLTELQQVCNHPAMYLRDGSGLKNRGAFRSGKFEALQDIVTLCRDQKRRMLVFTRFVAFGEMIAEFLGGQFGSPVPFYHGSLSPAQRSTMVEQFQSEQGPPAMVISIKAGGTGVTLTKASVVVHMDRWWNPAVENQATDRAHRIGQTDKVDVFAMMCTGTMEERVDLLLDAKTMIADATVKSRGAQLAALSNEDLRELVTLRGGSGHKEMEEQ